MNPDKAKIQLNLLIAVLLPGLSQKAEEVFLREHVPLLFRFHADGTASSEMLEILGLNDVGRNLWCAVLPKVFSEGFLRRMNRQLRLGAEGHGIAFTIPVSATTGLLIKLNSSLSAAAAWEAAAGSDQREEKYPMPSFPYSLILAVVDHGFSDDVMDAARPAGAVGGTVISSRQIADTETANAWGVSFQEEKEIVMILSSAEEKSAVLQAIAASCGAKSAAHGIVFSLPVDAAAGVWD